MCFGARCKDVLLFCRAQLSILSMVLLLFISVSYANPPEKTVTIRISTQHTPTMATFPPLIFFKKHVEEASKGSIAVEIHHSAELYSDTKIGPAVSAGAIEMGIVDLSRYAEEIPAADVFQLPFVFNAEGLEDRATAPSSSIRSLIDAAIGARYGVRVLWWTSLGQTVFESNGVSVANPEAIVGKTVRTIGPTTSALVSECGGIPRDIGGPRMEKAFQAREVDMSMTGISTVFGRHLWRYMDTITRTNHSSVQFVAVINARFWARLSKEQKAILETAARAADADARRVNAEIEAKAYKELEEKHGMKISKLTPDQLALWRICSSDVLQHYLEKSGRMGLDVMRAYGRMLAEPAKQN